MRIFAIVLALLGTQVTAAEPDKKSDPITWDDAATPNPYDQFDPKPEKLGPGPHTLIISDGNAMTQREYASGPKCQAARDVVRSQFEATRVLPNGGVIYSTPGVKAFCVPR